MEKESGQYDDHDRPIMVVDQELTAAAMQKADELKQAFLDWVWTDDERRTMLTTLYNERFNTHVPPRYDGSHIQLVGGVFRYLATSTSKGCRLAQYSGRHCIV